MLSLQGSAGNRAVADLVQRRRERPPRTTSEPGSLLVQRQVDDRDKVVEDKMTVPLGAPDRPRRASSLGRSIPDQRAPQPGTVLRFEASDGRAVVGPLLARAAVIVQPTTNSPAPVLATAQTQARERSPANVIGYKQTSGPFVQRHSITSGWFKKEVKFKLNDLKADFDQNGLRVARKSASLKVGSYPFRATGTVTATGTPGEVAKYELGFVQTLFQSSVRGRYKRRGHHRTIPERVLPSALGQNQKFDVTTGLTGLLPVKDGDEYVGTDKRKKLYYETGDVVAFGNASPDQRTTKLYDRPSSKGPWTFAEGGHDFDLVRRSGLDSFRTWLVIRKKSWSSTSYRRLGYVDWQVDYKCKVTPNVANPQASTVTPGSGSGGQITSRVKGVGVYLPTTGAESANESLKPTWSNW